MVGDPANRRSAGANPWWSLAIFFLRIWIVYGIVILGDDEYGPAT